MSDENSEQSRQPARRDRRGSRRRRFSVGIWMILFNFVLLLLVAYTILSLTQSSLSVPNWLTRQLEQQVNETLPGGRVSVGRMFVQISNRGLPSIRLSNLGIYDDTGAEIARLNRASLRVSTLGALQGEIKPRRLEISGAQITLRRRTDGQFALSFGGGQDAIGSPAMLLDELDGLFETDVMSDVADVGLRDLTISVEDARSGRVWQITDGLLRLQRTSAGLDLALSFDVFNGTVDLAETEFSIRTFSGDSSASIGARFSNVAAADIALQSPALSFLSVVNAPISGAARTDIGSSGEVEALAVTLEFGRGALQPTNAAEPIGFDAAKAYFNYDPARAQLEFSQVSVSSDSLNLTASGRTYLKDFVGPWPGTFLGQFQLSQLAANLYEGADEPARFDSGAADLRVRLDPFEVDFGQITLGNESERFFLSGRAAAGAAGWEVDTDLLVEEIAKDRLLALWPRDFSPQTRDWFASSVTSGLFSGIRFAYRQRPKAAPRMELGFNFVDTAIRFARGLPPLRSASGYGVLSDKRMVVSVEQGTLDAPNGGLVDLSGSVFSSDDVYRRPARAKVSVAASGSATDILSTLDLAPIRILAGSNLAPDFVDARATLNADVEYDMKPDLKPGEIGYRAVGVLQNASSTVLVPGKRVDARRLDVTAGVDGVEIVGPFRIGEVDGFARWTKINSPEFVGQSQLTGQVELSASTVTEFNLGLPDGTVGGNGTGDFRIAFRSGEQPELTLRSDLQGLSLAIPQVGWRSAEGDTGSLEVTARLGDQPAVDRLSMTAPGMSLDEGRITFDEEGRFERAIFGRVNAGWLDAPVTLTGRGSGLSPSIAVSGGVVDTRRLNTASGGQEGGSTPIDLALDRVIVSDGIAITGVSGSVIAAPEGLNGNFTGNVNGGARISGELTPAPNGTAIRIRAGNGGRVLEDAGIFSAANRGRMELLLTPRRGPVRYRGQLTITDMNVARAPVLTELLSALSIIGLLDQMRGAGIVFSRVQGEFNVTENQIRLLRSSAVGPSLGISLDGTYSLVTKALDMQGVVSPVYFLNAIGQIFSPRQGEGLFGFNYRLTGTADEPVVQVNPLSILTPGAFRDIFRANPPGASN